MNRTEGVPGWATPSLGRLRRQAWLTGCCLLALALGARQGPARAADPHVQAGRWFLYNSATPNFPSAADVISAAVDGEQRVWIGTKNGGLAMFDGFTWTRYTRESTRGLLLSDTVQYVGASGGTIYIGTPAGANVFTPATDRWGAYTMADGLPSNNIRAVAVTSSGLALSWYLFATVDAGMAICSAVVNPDGSLNCSRETQANGKLPSDYIYDMGVSGRHYWLATVGGVVWVRRSPLGADQRTTFTASNAPGGPQITPASSVTVDYGHNRVWFGLSQAVFGFDGGTGVGACVYDMGTNVWRHFDSDSGLPGNTVMDIAVDREGRAWFASMADTRGGPDTGGLYVYTWVSDSCCWQEYRPGDPPGTVPSTFVRSAVATLDRVYLGHGGAVSSAALAWQRFSQDVQALASLPGALWVGTPNGLLSFNGASFRAELPGVDVQDILALAPDDIWIATRTGVHHWTGNRWRQFTTGDSTLASDNVTSLAQDGLGRVWAGTAADGVSVYSRQGNSWTTFDTSSGLLANAVRDVAATAAGDVWVATAGGLGRYDGAGWTSYTAQGGLPADDVRAVAVDAAGVVWAGTALGAASWDGAAWTNVAPQMPADEILAIHAPATGGVWFGVVGGAIFRGGSNWDFYRSRNSGLTHERIRVLASDGDGGVWFGGLPYTAGSLGVPGGLFVRTLSDAPLGEGNPTISTFDPASGIADTQVTLTGTGFQPATRVYFGANAPGAGQLAQVVSASATRLVVRVPSQATRGPLRVANGTRTGVSAGSFTPIPRITDIQPRAGGKGIRVEIQGTNLRGLGLTQVQFGTSASSSLPVYSLAHDLLKAYVPLDATNGPVTVRTGADPMVATGPDFTVTGNGLTILDAEIHQGLPGYQHRIAGKSTVVRVFLGSDDPDGGCAFATSGTLYVLRLGQSTPKTYFASLEKGEIPNGGEFCGRQKQDAAGGSIDFVVPGADLTGQIYDLSVAFRAGFVDLASRSLGRVTFTSTGDLKIHVAAPGEELWGDMNVYPGMAADRMGPVSFEREVRNVNRIYPVRDGVGGPESDSGLRYLANPAFQMCNGVDDGFCGRAEGDYDFRYDFWQEDPTGILSFCMAPNFLIGRTADDGSVLRFRFDLAPGAEKRIDVIAIVRPGATLPPNPADVITVNTGNISLVAPTAKATKSYSHPQCGKFTYDDVLFYTVGVKNTSGAPIEAANIALDYDQTRVVVPGSGGMVLGNDNTIATYRVPGRFFMIDGNLGGFDPPLDFDYNGVIDVGDIDLVAEEFDHWDPAAGRFTLSTDFSRLGVKDMMRNFVDANGDLIPNDGEKWSPFLLRHRTVRYAVYDVPLAYRDAFNETSSADLQFSQLWLWRGILPFGFMGLGGQAVGPVSMWAMLDDNSAVVHELGHNTGLHHSADPRIPGVAAGYNTLERRVVLGPQMYSTMSAGVSGPLGNVFFDPAQEYATYTYFRDRREAQSLAGLEQSSGALFHVAGILHRDRRVEVSRSYLTSGLEATTPDPAGGHWLRFLASGRTLTEVRFAIDFAAADRPEGQREPDEAPFAVTQPFPEGTTSIELWDRSGPLVTLPVSAAAPGVTVVSPNGGERLAADGTLTMSWNGTDPDGDPLTYAVRYSADGGATWTVLAVDTTATRIEVPAASLPGSGQALVEVRASDGVHTASDRSDASFEVAGKPPRWAVVSAPAAGEKRVHGQPVLLVGGGNDLEDGLLEGGRLTWESDQLGPLGTGDSITATLPVGVHALTLAATDSDGLRATTTITVQVLADFDRDGLADDYERRVPSLAWWNPTDAGRDMDDDGLTARSEAAWGTDPANSDTDGDGASDGDEAAAGSAPLDPAVQPQPPRLLASAQSLRFAMAAGGADPESVSVMIMSSRATTITWTSSVTGAWLRLDRTAGDTPTEVQVSVDGGGLAVGDYSGQIQFRGGGSTVLVPVTLTVVDPTSPSLPTSTASPTGQPEPTGTPSATGQATASSTPSPTRQTTPSSTPRATRTERPGPDRRIYLPWLSMLR